MNMNIHNMGLSMCVWLCLSVCGVCVCVCGVCVVCVCGVCVWCVVSVCVVCGVCACGVLCDVCVCVCPPPCVYGLEAMNPLYTRWEYVVV